MLFLALLRISEGRKKNFSSDPPHFQIVCVFWQFLVQIFYVPLLREFKKWLPLHPLTTERGSREKEIEV